MKLNKMEANQGDECQDRFSGLASVLFMGSRSDAVLFLSYIGAVAVSGKSGKKGKGTPSNLNVRV